jgi:2-acylglycerol O-acyltransferase 2
LGFIFGLTLFYPLLLLALALASWYWPCTTWALLIVPLLSSLWWAGSPWAAITHSRVLDAWRSHFSLRVWREPWDGAPAATAGLGTLFVLVPHGVFPMGLPLLSGPVAEQVFPDLNGQQPRGAVASAFFWLPILAPLVTWLGGVPAERTTLEQLLRSGTSCFLFPDGVAGAYSSHSRESEIVRLGGRKRFEQMARSLGAPIVPIYCFGHSQLFRWSWPPAQHWLARMARRLRIAFIWYWPLIPNGTLDIVVGAPLASHDTFEDAIAALYVRHQESMKHAHRTLTIL